MWKAIQKYTLLISVSKTTNIHRNNPNGRRMKNRNLTE